MKAVIAIALACAAWFTDAIKLDCSNPDSINEERIHYCCKHPDGHSEIMEDCAKQTGFKLPNPNEEAIVDLTATRAIAGTCFGKCIFSKLNFMEGNELDMSVVKAYYTKNYANDPEYVKEMIDAFDHCHGLAQENTAMFLSSDMFRHISRDHFCEPKSSVIWACVIREFFHNCPADRWSKTKECDDVQEYSKNCNTTLATL